MNARARFHAPRIVQPGYYRARRVRAVLLLLLLVGVAGLGWRLGCRGEITALQQTRLELDKLRRQLASQETERQTLHQKLETLRQGRTVDRESLGLLKEEIRKLQEERIQASQELELMRSVLSNDSAESTLQVQDFGVQQLDADNHYRVAFTVRQLNKEFGVARGSIRFSLAGETGGRKQLLALEELVADQVGSLKMRFRYFQKVEQEIRLPSGFVPRSVTVEVDPDNQDLPPVAQVFPWPPRS